MNEQCVFCRIIAGEEMVSIVHEDDRAIAFMDIQPYTPGHVLVVPREHHTDLFGVPDALAAHCLALARRLGPGIKRATGAAALNIFSANGAAGGQDVPHFHLHLIPVREGEDFDLQLPKPGAAVPSRSGLDVMAARIGRACQEVGNDEGSGSPRKAAAGSAA